MRNSKKMEKKSFFSLKLVGIFWLSKKVTISSMTKEIKYEELLTGNT